MINLTDIISLIKELIQDKDKMAKFKEIIEDLKELISDLKDAMKLIKGEGA